MYYYLHPVLLWRGRVEVLRNDNSLPIFSPEYIYEVGSTDIGNA